MYLPYIYMQSVQPPAFTHLSLDHLLQGGFLESSPASELDHLLHPLMAVPGIHLYWALGEGGRKGGREREGGREGGRGGSGSERIGEWEDGRMGG